MEPWDSLRLQFPVVRELVYLNHAAVSPLPLRSQMRMQEYLHELSHYGCARYPGRIYQVVDEARALGAQLMGAQVDNVFIVRSTTQGLAIAATGIPFVEGDNVVLVKQEFPANLRPWLPLRRRGVEVRLVEQSNGRVLMDDLALAIDSRTRAVSVSFVQFLSGFRIDLAKVAQLCKKSDALLVVDAIQGLGVFPLHVQEMGIDFLSADAHKWLLGPEGVGLGYASPRALERIEPSVEGWLSVRNPFDFFDINQPLKDSASRFEDGAFNLAGIHGMLGSLELLASLGGVPSLCARILELTDYLVEGLHRIGWDTLSPRDHNGEKSGIVLTVRQGLDMAALGNTLKEGGIVVSHPAGAMRVSPHGENTHDDLDRLLSVLDRA